MKSIPTARSRPVIRRFAVFCFCLLVSSPLLALDPGRKISQYGLTRYSTEQGLPQNHVTSIVQSADGYLWAGTDDGLVQFDGFGFRVFDKRNTAGLPSSLIEALLADPKDGLWVGTSGGLVRFRNGKVESVGSGDQLVQQRITELTLGAEGCVYAGTTSGVLRICRDKVERLEGLRDVMIMALATGPGGEIFIGTRQKGLWRYDKGRMEQIPTSLPALTGTIVGLFVDSSGRLWIGPREGGLYRGRCPELRDLERVSEAGTEEVDTFSETPVGYVWAGTSAGSLCRFDGQSRECFALPLLSKSRSVHSLMADREGNLWAGSWSDGLFRLRDGVVKAFASEEGLAGDEFWTVIEDRNGDIWAGSMGGGVSRLSGGRVETFTKGQGLPSENVRSMAAGPDGSIWVGFFDAPLTTIRNGTVSVYRLPGGQTIGPAWSLMSGRDGSLWFGNRECGVCKLKDGKVESLLEIDGFPRVPGYAFLEDDSGDIWVGTGGEGLVRVRSRQAKVFRTQDGLPSGMVMDLYQESSGKLWLATDGGLARFDGERFGSLGLAQGLPDDVLHSVLEDSDGYLWMSTNHGLIRISKREAEEVLEGRRTSVEALSLGAAAGMKSAEGTGSTQPNAIRGRDGRLWFTTVRGIVAVEPAALKRPSLEPEVVIESFRSATLVSPALAGQLVVPAGSGEFEFRYTAFLYREAEDLEFRYRLDGLRSEWTEAGKRREAFFTHIPIGEYTFRVAARRPGGAWHEGKNAIRIAIRPRFFETLWFRLVILVALAGATAGVFKIRLRALERRREELELRVQDRTRDVESALRKEAIARAEAEAERRRSEEASRAKSMFLASMSHELRTPLNAILGFVQVMARTKGRSAEDRKYLEIILNSGEHLLALINDVLSISKIEAGQVEIRRKPFSLRDLLKSATEMVRPRAEAKDLDLELEMPASFPALVIGDEARIRQVLLNLLSNAVKFTVRGVVTLRAFWDAGRIRIEVEDTGGGMKPEEKERLFQAFVQTEAGSRSGEGTGLGLSISQKLIRLMGGELEVESRPGVGTKFWFSLEMPEAKSHISRPAARRVVGLAPGQKSRKVLVADDTSENRLLLAEMQRATGLEVLEASDGEMVLSFSQLEKPDLIWLDEKMPGMAGTEVLRRIRTLEQESGDRRVPVIAVTASAFQESTEKLLAAGFDGILCKPFRHGEVFDLLSQHLGIEFVFEEISGDYASRRRPRSNEILGAVVSVPKELRDRLRRAAVESDLAAALEAIQEIEKSDSATAKTLRELAESFRFEEIEGLMGGRKAG